MKRAIWLKLLVVSGLGVSIGSLPVLAHGNHKHVCKKDGKVIKIKGKSNDDKKAACEAKGGEWEEVDE